jgi:hypothetical protein
VNSSKDQSSLSLKISIESGNKEIGSQLKPKTQKMKNKILSLVSIVFSVWLMSCDNSESGQSLKIEGSWKIISSESFNCPNSSDNKTLTCGTYVWCLTITFNTDMTFTLKSSSSGLSAGSGTYQLKNGTLSLMYPNSSTPANYAVTVSGTTLITITNNSSSCSTRDTYEKV